MTQMQQESIIRMPADIVLVRHGQSEGNLAVHASKRGDDSHVLHPEFAKRHSSWWHLTDLGIEQAKMAGEWVTANIGSEFGRYYTSAYTRAMQTAGHMGLPDARWYIEPRLRERERGREDLLTWADHQANVESIRERASAPLYWRPMNGESIADCMIRVRNVLDTLARECSGGKVIIVCHGEVMESFRLVLERMTHHQYMEWTSSDNPHDRIHNGQVFHYSRRDPQTGELGPHLDWFRSISTSDLSLCDPNWRKVQRPVYDNEALLAEAGRMERIFHA
jgi:NAD+ kinase